jgi:hypothetical protein
MADTDYLAASDGTGDAALMHVSTPRTAGATIIQVDTVAGVPAFFIGTWGTLLATGFIDPTTKRDFFGHVNAGTLVIDKMAPGNVDGGNTTGQVVVIKPSTPTQNLVGNFVKTALNLFSQGELLNGKIVPTISTNNLVVSLKTLNGVDPSTTDVVYVRIGDTVRSVTAPLSVTLAAGTNWFGKGSAPFATFATNFFVYMGYNTTNGVTLGVSSTATAYRYSDFSTTNTDWNYAKISNITNATATDVYENVGRINAILGVTATFLWTLPANNLAISQPSREILQYPSDFSVYRAAALTYGSPAVVPMDTANYDLGKEVDLVTNKGRFTPKVTGLYSFKAGFGVNANGAGFQAMIYKNGSQYRLGASYIQAGGSWANLFIAEADILLTPSDYVEPAFYGSGNAAAVGNANCFFDGFLRKAL